MKENESRAYALVYKLYFPAIRNFIVRNHGNDQDAEDIFQETMIILHQKNSLPDFKLSCSIKTFLFSIAKNLWLKKLRDNKYHFTENISLFENFNKEASSGFEKQEESNNEEKLGSWFKKITENCKKLLKAIFFLKQPIEKLIKQKGWKNKHTADNQKYKCLQQLKKQAEK